MRNSSSWTFILIKEAARFCTHEQTQTSQYGQAAGSDLYVKHSRSYEAGSGVLHVAGGLCRRTDKRPKQPESATCTMICLSWFSARCYWPRRNDKERRVNRGVRKNRRGGGGGHRGTGLCNLFGRQEWACIIIQSKDGNNEKFKSNSQKKSISEGFHNLFR